MINDKQQLQALAAENQNPVGIDDSVIVPTKLLIALIETAKRSTDLSGVYGDDAETYFSWEEVNKFLEG